MTVPTLYKPPETSAQIDIDLSKNEGAGWDGSFSIADDDVSRYPDVRGLTARLAGLLDVGPSEILVTAGGDDGLARCFQAFAGKDVVSTTPSFEMIPRYAAQNRSTLTEIEWWSGPFPVDEICAVDAELAVAVSPNNPTGSVASEDDLRALASRFPVVVLDAAYEEFATAPLTRAAMSLDNVLVIRTLSKAYGLAGLRVGYVLGAPDLISTIARYGSPYAVASPSARIAERPRR